MFIQIETPPAVEPVSLEMAKSHLRVTIDDDDDLISEYIQAARERVEGYCGKSYVSKGYIQVHDNFPQYTDSIFSQQAFPPDYYAQGRYTSNYWNYSQQIKLLRAPLLKVDRIEYVSSVDQTIKNLYGIADRWEKGAEYVIGDRILDSNGNVQEVIAATESEEGGASTAGASEPSWNATPGQHTADNDLTWNNLGAATGFTDFLEDRYSEPPRLFPPAGSYWPGAFYVPNAVRIHFRAGFGEDDKNVPAVVKVAIKQLVANYYEFREPVSSLYLREIPQHFENLLANERVWDFSPTRG